MKLNVITDDKGNLVAATLGHVGEAESIVTRADAKIAAQAETEEGVGGVVLMPGQTVRQVEVADRLFDPDNLVELRQHLTEALST